MPLLRLRFLLGAIAILCVAPACTDDVAAPESAAPVESPMFKVIPTYAADMKSADIIVEPSGGVFTLGRHSIWFPANSICDPETSTYGLTEWDKPCAPISEPIRIHAKLREQDGRSWVDFSPELRFVPSNDERRWVYLFMSTRTSERPRRNNVPPILWSPAIGMPGIDESLTDATLKTHWSRQFRGVYRRIKHFSGYNVHSGYAPSRRSEY
jgi:hypothetical protein